MASKSRGIVVLGMHRAGTSATGHILVDLGFQMPGEAVPADPDNPKGYWEPQEIVEIHDAFLHDIGRCWSDPRPLDVEVFKGEAAIAARERLRAVVKHALLPRKRWVLKDPRMCRLMPLWEGLLEEPGLDYRFLHVLRSPLSVADSLYRRDKFSHEKSFLLWLRHNLEAEAATRNSQRSWLSFEEVSGASAQVNERFRSATGLSRLSGKRIQHAVSEVLDRSLVHSDHGMKESLEQLAAYPWVASAYQALTSLSLNGGKQGQAELDELRPQIVKADALKLGDPEFWGPQLITDRLHWLRESIEHQRLEIKAQRAEVDALRTTFDDDRLGQAGLRHEIGARYSDLIQRLHVSEEMQQSMAAALSEVGDASRTLGTLHDELKKWARHQASVADQRQEGVESLRSSLQAWVREQVESQDQQRKLVAGLHETLEKWARRQTEIDDQRRLVTHGLLDNLNASLGAVGARIHQLENQTETIDQAVAKYATVSDQSQTLVRQSLNALGDQTRQLRNLSGAVEEISRRQAKAEELGDEVAESLAQLGDYGLSLGELKGVMAEVAVKQDAAADRVLEAVSASLAASDEQRLEIKASLGSLDAQSGHLAGPDQSFGDQRKSFASISKGVEKIESLIVERLEIHHLALLSKSLEVSAAIETRWKSAQLEVAEVALQRDAVIAERDRTRVDLDVALRQRDAAIQARAAAAQGRDAALQERREVIQGRDIALVEQSHVFAHELDRLRAELELLRRERDQARNEIGQMVGRFSWKLTAPLRAVLKGLKSLRP